MTRAAARTGTGPIAMVAVEQRFPSDQRLIADDLARSIVPSGTRVALSLMGPRSASCLIRMTEIIFRGAVYVRRFPQHPTWPYR